MRCGSSQSPFLARSERRQHQPTAAPSRILLPISATRVASEICTSVSKCLANAVDDYVDKVRELYHWTPEEDGDGEELLKVKSTVTQFNVVSLPSFGTVSCNVLPVSGGYNHQGHPPLGANCHGTSV